MHVVLPATPQAHVGDVRDRCPIRDGEVQMEAGGRPVTVEVISLYS